MTTAWDSVTVALAERGWQARVVAAERLDDLRERVAGVLGSSALPEATARHLAEEVAFVMPEGVAARSVVVGAVARPLTQATLTLGGAAHTVPVPPHYAGYYTVPDQLTAVVASALAFSGHRGVRLGRPAARRCRVGRAAAARALRALRAPACAPTPREPSTPTAFCSTPSAARRESTKTAPRSPTGSTRHGTPAPWAACAVNRSAPRTWTSS